MNGKLQSVPQQQIGDTIGTPPSERLVKSIATFGVIQPVLLAELVDEDGEIELRVVDGNRRVAAARAAHVAEIPAVVLSDLTAAEIAQCTLVTNGFRTANYLAEFWAIDALTRSQYSASEVQGISGMARSGVELRANLKYLHRDLLIALRNGRIAQADAVAVAKMPAQEQDIAVAHFRQKGHLSRKDLRALFPSTPSSPSEDAPTGTSVEAQLHALAALARDQHFTRGEFLALAAAAWDESVAD